MVAEGLGICKHLHTQILYVMHEHDFAKFMKKQRFMCVYHPWSLKDYTWGNAEIIGKFRHSFEKCLVLSSILCHIIWANINSYIYIYEYLFLYLCIYIYMCVYVWCVCSLAAVFHLTIWLNNKDTFSLYNFLKIISSSWCLGFRLELVDEFTKLS